MTRILWIRSQQKRIIGYVCSVHLPHVVYALMRFVIDEKEILHLQRKTFSLVSYHTIYLSRNGSLVFCVRHEDFFMRKAWCHTIPEFFTIEILQNMTAFLPEKNVQSCQPICYHSFDCYPSTRERSFQGCFVCDETMFDWKAFRVSLPSACTAQSECCEEVHYGYREYSPLTAKNISLHCYMTSSFLQKMKKYFIV